MVKKEKEKIVAPKIANIKNFWAYALILFSAALILIIISDTMKEKIIGDIQKQLDIKNKDITANVAMVENVQKVNEQLSSELNDKKSEIDGLKENLEIQTATIKQANKSVQVLSILNEAQRLWISKKYTAARAKMAEIDKATIPEDIKSTYEAIAKIIK